MRWTRVIPVTAAAAMSVWGLASPASASGAGGKGGGSSTCTGTVAAPGTLAGNFSSNVTVNGACLVDAGAATVNGNLTVSPGSVLVAAFGLDDQTGTGNSSLTVRGNVVVGSGATLIMGCEPIFFTCVDDATAQNGPGTLTSNGTVGGNVIGSDALSIIVHASSVGKNVTESGGGQGQNCDTPAASPDNTDSVQFWAVFAQSPPYSDYEDTNVSGNTVVSDLNTCWLGVARDQVGKNVILDNIQLADPDGIEILSNSVANNLVCQGNSFVWDSSEANFGQMGLFPRAQHPNTVNGHRVGQCVLSSPTTPGGPLGPGPF